eukprot:14791901-Heterocapsa_arctica.AAC.1
MPRAPGWGSLPPGWRDSATTTVRPTTPNDWMASASTSPATIKGRGRGKAPSCVRDTWTLPYVAHCPGETRSRPPPPAPLRTRR